MVVGKPRTYLLKTASSRYSVMNSDYRYLGDWTDRNGNSNIEEPLLDGLTSQNAGYTPLPR